MRNFEIIGEAANRLGTDFHEIHRVIEWTRLRGFRNRIVHHYFGIDYEIVWSIMEFAGKILIKSFFPTSALKIDSYPFFDVIHL